LYLPDIQSQATHDAPSRERTAINALCNGSTPDFHQNAAMINIAQLASGTAKTENDHAVFTRETHLRIA